MKDRNFDKNKLCRSVDFSDFKCYLIKRKLNDNAIESGELLKQFLAFLRSSPQLENVKIVPQIWSLFRNEIDRSDSVPITLMKGGSSLEVTYVAAKNCNASVYHDVIEAISNNVSKLVIDPCFYSPEHSEVVRKLVPAAFNGIEGLKDIKLDYKYNYPFQISSSLGACSFALLKRNLWDCEGVFVRKITVSGNDDGTFKFNNVSYIRKSSSRGDKTLLIIHFFTIKSFLNFCLDVDNSVNYNYDGIKVNIMVNECVIVKEEGIKIFEVLSKMKYLNELYIPMDITDIDPYICSTMCNYTKNDSLRIMRIGLASDSLSKDHFVEKSFFSALALLFPSINRFECAHESIDLCVLDDLIHDSFNVPMFRIYNNGSSLYSGFSLCDELHNHTKIVIDNSVNSIDQLISKSVENITSINIFFEDVSNNEWIVSVFDKFASSMKRLVKIQLFFCELLPLLFSKLLKSFFFLQNECSILIENNSSTYIDLLENISCYERFSKLNSNVTNFHFQNKNGFLLYDVTPALQGNFALNRSWRVERHKFFQLEFKEIITMIFIILRKKIKLPKFIIFLIFSNFTPKSLLSVSNLLINLKIVSKKRKKML